MSALLKDIYNKALVQRLAANLSQHLPLFQQKEFTRAVLDEQWEKLELKERMRHITRCLHRFMPLPYPQQLDLLYKVAPGYTGLAGIIFPDFVEVFGLEHYGESVAALAAFTSYSSSEFAVRPFILRYPAPMLEQMLQWATHENHHVRRLASEGCRPRLPWAMGLPALKKDPSPVLPILEVLKADPSDYVRRSVANNLNDISKDHPDVVLQIAASWLGTDENTNWIIRHACRGLIRKGHPQALALFGLQPVQEVKIIDLAVETPAVSIGSRLSFRFSLHVSQPQKIRIEYVIHYARPGGKHGTKVFKLVEKFFEPGQAVFSKSHSFQQMTTRRHYPGEHRVAIYLNGVAFAEAAFEVV
ncbi:DNA alkylation repair protein [Pontibacter sp. SGAir0037]|uniref:DNA alkylation repair protein n=1 Tax=Pontibacter sp. SGAir0037 TaxID=2571030 RepID=UPI0010CCCEAD|nr:DNA alkylation repair protein [Pontibacter sp. SGAir0037]QCR24485.1 DNA alkylation repair protein [Pontibacter sp. SGAir0037]